MIRPLVFVAAATAIVAAVAFRLIKQAPGANWVEGAGANVGGAAVDLVNGAVSGVVVGLGDGMGLPRVDKGKGQSALDEGRYWDASFLLNPVDLVSGIWNKVTN